MSGYRTILFINGMLLTTLGLAMLLAGLTDILFGAADATNFVAAAFVTAFFGLALAMANYGQFGDLQLRHAFLLTTSTWLALPTFAALPFAFAELQLSYTDAFFEAMSGITTTGSTVIVNLEGAPRSILIWRAILQWLGGIGIIVTAVAILPMLRVGGMQLFRMESSDQSEKILPRAGQISFVIAAIYMLLTALCTFAYWLAGMGRFDALAHAMTTIATGGFATSDASFGAFDSMAIDYIAVLFMVLGSLPFLLYFQILRGQPWAIWRDSQVRLFLGLLVVLIFAIALWLVAYLRMDFWAALRASAFNVTSVITGTGYASENYMTWGPFAVATLFFVMFIGGCAGSTSCGIKVFRLHVLAAATRTQLARMLRPHSVVVARFNGRPIPEQVTDSVISFVFLFLLSFGILATLLNLLGLDLMTSLSGAATAIANVGPGLGSTIGPAGNFASLPDAAKWLLSAGMLLGRLELFTILVLFAPTFWRA